MAVHWSLRFLETLLPANLFKRLNEVQCDRSHQNDEDETIYIYNSITGEPLKELSMPDMKRLSRSKLRALCTTDIPVLFGKTFPNMTFDASTAPVTAHFADGASYSGDIIVGADGPRS